MQTVVYILLLLLGVILIIIGTRSLKNLAQNNRQWQFIQIQSALFDEYLFEEYQNAEQNIIRYLQKYTPIVNKFALFNGIISVLGALLGLFNKSINMSFNLVIFGYIGIIILSLLFVYFIRFMDTILETHTNAHHLYKLYTNYFTYEYNKRNYLDKKQVMPYDYLSEFNYQYLMERKKSNGIFPFSALLLLAFHMGLFLFLTAFFLDKNFYQMIMFA